MPTAAEVRKQIQVLLHVAEDGFFGPKTQAAFDYLSALAADSAWPIVSNAAQPGTVHEVTASSFADPADVRAFERCKASGNSDQFCFGKGDNGIGKWDDSTRAGSGPSCALPPEDWNAFGAAAHGKKVLVKANGREVICRLLDTMPHKANITNGCGIDLNPDAVAELGLTPPIEVPATWEWSAD